MTENKLIVDYFILINIKQLHLFGKSGENHLFAFVKFHKTVKGK